MSRFISLRHVRSRDAGKTFWHATRHAATKKGDAGSDVMISLLDLSGRHARPDSDALTAKNTCTNRDLPSQLPFGEERGDFELEGSLHDRAHRVACASRTPSLRPAFDRSLLWRKISHFSLNYLSLVEEGKEALQEILRLYNYSESVYLERQIDGILSVKSRRHFARVVTELSVSFVRGTRVEMEIDDDQFVGGGAYLFASILESFLGLYVSMNSFSQLVVRTPQRKEVLREMATARGPENSSLMSPELAEMLRSNPWSFDFFQAVRLLERIHPEREPVGKFSVPSSEAAKFRSHPSTAFPASEIQSLRDTDETQGRRGSQFHGLVRATGSSAVVLYRTDRERARVRDTALIDFLDIFNHRLISLFYRAWEKIPVSDRLRTRRF